MKLLLIWCFLLQSFSVLANTEKTIFLGPARLEVPLEHPTLEDLQLEALSPQDWSVRTHIRAEFPTDSSKYGQASWYLLHGLEEGQRYEVRICWAATVNKTRTSKALANQYSNQLRSVSRLMNYRLYSKHRN